MPKMLFVEIEKENAVRRDRKTENEILAGWFSELRNWLDLNRCEPLVFNRTGRPLDRLIYRISFESSAQAQKFSERFARYSPSVRRATPYERGQLRTMAEQPVQAAP